jgi:hypothetical protein
VQTVRTVATFEGVRELPMAVYPGAIQGHTKQELQQNVEKIFDQIVDGITKPVTGSITAAAAPNPEQLALEGTLDEINAYFLSRKWSDGHPIIPPTADKVREFLKYTDRAAHDVIATLPISYTQATPRNIAVNAIMAGCRPEYMPVLIAAVEALGDPGYDITGLGSTGGYMPFFVINGPIARELDIRSDLPAISHPANAVIGRALGLIIRNIAGFIPGETAMGTFGYILPFVFAENEDVCNEIGWEPFHVRHGHDSASSVVTVGGSGNWGHQSTPTGADAAMLAEYGVREVLRRVIAERSVARRDASGMFSMVITPSVSRVLAQGGYSVQDLTNYWFTHSTITRREYDFRSKYGQSTTPAPTIQSLLDKGAIDPKLFDKEPDDPIPIFQTPDTMHVFVSGDKGRNKYMSFWGPYFKPVLKEIRLPAQWHELMHHKK